MSEKKTTVLQRRIQRALSTISQEKDRTQWYRLIRNLSFIGAVGLYILTTKWSNYNSAGGVLLKILGILFVSALVSLANGFIWGQIIYLIQTNKREKLDTSDKNSNQAEIDQEEELSEDEAATWKKYE